MTNDSQPLYLRIAGELGDQIRSGELAPGVKLPSESEIMRAHSVSRMVAKMAIRTLRDSGLIDSHPGRGSFVRSVNRIVRQVPERYRLERSGITPVESDVDGDVARQHASAHTTADESIAGRLGVPVGDPVMQTDYRYVVGDEPVQVAVSYEPLALTRGTPIEYPEDSIVRGVVARMESIGHAPDAVVEKVITRSAHPQEAEKLRLRTGAFVLAIERTYYAGSVAVETANIVFSGDRYELAYHLDI